MKKRTKKKLAKYSKKAGIGLLKLVFVYPVKGAWYLIKKIRSKKESEGKKAVKGKVKNNASFNKLKEIKNVKGNLAEFEKKILTNKSTIGLILGARGTGKSAIGMRLLENFKVKTKKNIYAMGFKIDSLPNWIKVVSNVQQIKNDSVVLVDEGGIEFSSRKTMSNANTVLSELMLIARHKDLGIIFITQNSANLEINVIRQADYLLLKASSLLQKDFERTKIKKIYESVEEDFEKLKETLGITYIYADVYRGFATNTLPSFWTDRVSKGYSGK